MPHTEARWDVGFPAERSIATWQERYARGEVPGRWPYGLDALERFATLRAVDLPAPGRLARARARIGAGPRPVADAIGITWDENAALRMATVAPHTAHVSGVIWLTDAVARGRDAGRMPRVLARCAGLWVLSEAQLEPLVRVVPGARPRYVRFGIDSEFFTARPYPDRPRVVSVGGDRDRDTATLFAALEHVHRARPEVELVVQTSSELPAPAGIRTIRHVPHRELRELYASASVVTIATHENLHVSGMTVSLEAMATGRPVAITETPGMADYVAHDETGLLSPVGDATALAEHTLALLDDPDRASGMGTAGCRAVEERFTSATMADAIDAVVRGTH